MKIELKSIYHSIQLSEETETFTANLNILHRQTILFIQKCNPIPCSYN